MTPNVSSLIENSGAEYPLLVETYYAPLYQFALSLAKHSSDACDLTQQTFYIWSTKSRPLRDKSKVKTWLFTTLYRQFLQGHRKAKRLIAFDDLAPGDRDPPEIKSDEMEEMDGQMVMEALQEVDPIFREALTLFYLQNLSYAEIAGILVVPVGTVTSRLARGKAQLRLRFLERVEAFESGQISFPRLTSEPAPTWEPVEACLEFLNPTQGGLIPAA